MDIDELTREEIEEYLQKRKSTVEANNPARRMYIEVYRGDEIAFEYPVDIGEYPDGMDDKFKTKIDDLIKAHRSRIDEKVDGMDAKQFFLSELDNEKIDAFIISAGEIGYIEEKSNKGGAFFILLGELKEEKMKRSV
jgi:hypothetical protein